MSRIKTSLLLFLLLPIGCGRELPQPESLSAPHPKQAERISYTEHVVPILKQHCTECHGADVQEAGLRLDSLEAIVAGTRLDSVVEPGSSSTSRLWQVLQGDPPAMPQDRAPLTSAEMEVLAKWIDSNKQSLEDVAAQLRSRSEHWAYHAPQRPNLPQVNQQDWCRNEVDRFVLARMEAKGQTPSPEASRESLLRRVSLDLTGLPPTLAEIDQFLADETPDAYERVVDELLSSPRFGEHWGRCWLDLARYADTNGYHRDRERGNWRWRDWVIESFNRNQPFDQFSIEQLAGDLLPSPTREQLIATGFHRNTMFNQEGGANPEEFRVKAVVDRTATTATIWLGTTLGCAQCHNHPNDPFTQVEFYSFLAFFNNTTDTGGGLGFQPYPVLDPADPAVCEHLDGLRQKIHARMQELMRIGESVSLEADPILGPLLVEEAKMLREHCALIMEEKGHRSSTHVLTRGDYTQPGELVLPGTPAVLSTPGKETRYDRLSLARWLFDGSNPLVARVTANRWWQQIFGRGIVATTDDFGSQGAAPTHPELLDWLATELVESGWDRKALLRLIVTSATYRQSSDATPELLELDPQNLLLARAPRLRLDGETIHDNALFIGGLLSSKIGGRSVFPPQPEDYWRDVSISYEHDLQWLESAGEDRYRRGLYTFWRRSAPHPFYVSFDAPNREVCEVRRSTTNTPLQALATMNEPLMLEAATGLARRMREECHSDQPADKLAFGFRLCTGRKPTAPELVLLTDLLNEQDEETRGDTKWVVVANVLLNLDATLTRW